MQSKYTMEKGFQTIVFNNKKVHLYLQDSEVERLELICQNNWKETYPIEDYLRGAHRVACCVNANYFIHASVENYGQVLGVMQGISLDGKKTIDDKPEQKEWQVISINQQNEIQCSSADQYWITKKTDNIRLGVSPAAILINEGEIVNLYSNVSDYYKKIVPNYQTMLLQFEDKSFALAISSEPMSYEECTKFATYYGAKHLSIYDGGSSTQMIAKGANVPLMHNRKLPSVLAFCKK